MHIVFVTTELATSNNSSGGLASYTANMARIFALKGHKVTVLVAATKDEKLVFDENISLYVTFVKKVIWNAFDRAAKVCAFGKKEEVTEIRRFFVNIYKSTQVRNKIDEINRLEKVDFVHFCNLGSLAARANPGIPYVVRLSDMGNMLRGANTPQGDIRYEANKLSIKDKLTEYALKKARYVISPSELLANVCKLYLDINAVVLESPFVIQEQNWDYSVYDSIVKEKKYIIHYGSLKYLKGTHIVAQIAKKILESYPDFYLVLAGISEDLLDEKGNNIKAHKYVERCAEEYSDRVIYVGRLVREQLYPFIQNAQLCLLPSRIENLSNACIEAMAMGKIVVATNHASFEQLIDDRISGFLCERDNPDSYLNAINEALRMSDDDKNQIILKGRERVNLLSPDIIYEKYLSFYQKVMQEW